MAVLKFIDRKYVLALLRILAGKKQVSFEISRERMRVSTLAPSYFYLCIPGCLYETDASCEFTISIDDLIDSIRALSADVAHLNESFKLVAMRDASQDAILYEKLRRGESIEDMKYSFIDVPFTNPIRDSYVDGKNYHTRLLINKKMLRHFLPGRVTYSCRNGCLIMQSGDSVFEDTVKAEAEFLEEGFLDFCCTNDWMDSVHQCIDEVSAVLLCFAEGVLDVKLLFSKYKNAYLEIQVPEKLSGW